MGILSDTVKAILPARTTAISATVPVGTEGIAQVPAYSYERFSREGYGQNELVYACVEMLATSAGEARLCAYRGDEKIDSHPLLDLWNSPNPFLDGVTMAASLVMYRSIAGNAYIEKVRSGAGKIVELWLPRPDRVMVVPDRQRFVAGYDYVIGAETFRWPAEDIVHVKARNPLANETSDFYGYPPLAALAGRVDLDNWARAFTASFFANAGVPVGLLSIVKTVTEAERKMIQDRFAQMHGGPKNWHRLMVLDGGQATYTPMAVPLGESGAGLADLDEINEARICMAFGVPPSLVATRLGMNSSSYANRQSDKENFWELTLVPLYREMAGDLNTGFGLGTASSDYPDIDRLEFDTGSVRALQEDADKFSTRILAQLAAGAICQEEARVKLGYPEKPEVAEPTWLIPANIAPMKGDLTAPALPEPEEGDTAAAEEGDYPQLAAPASNGKPTNGRTNARG